MGLRDVLLSPLAGIVIDGVKELLDESSGKNVANSTSAQYGDVICVQKPGYYHYGIYISDNRVVHFAPKNEFSSLREAMENAVIHETTLKKFLGTGNKLYVCDFSKHYAEPSKRRVEYSLPGASVVANPFDIISKPNLFKSLQYKVYSPSETVDRALSKIGQTKYNLTLNNCEHFAIWCKTGIKESHQVNKILDSIKPTLVN